MKKLLAIVMALALCCSLVVSASAESIDTDYFYIDVADLDGTWTEASDWEAEFTNGVATLSVYVADESEIGDINEYYYDQMAEAEQAYYDDPDTYYFEEGEIDGCPAFCFDYYEGDVTGTVVLILTDNYVYYITIGATSEDYGALWDAVTEMTVYDVYSGDAGYEEEEEIVDDEEEEIVDDEEEDDKTSGDDEDEEEKDKKKKDKKDKDDDEDDEKDNTTLIIIVVAGVAVVAIAAVVIVLVTKKKQ